MSGTLMNHPGYQSVLVHVLEVVQDFARQNRPSPTIRQLALCAGYSEELILESLEFGTVEPASLLH
ncbi:hypothetical protein C6I21_02070 [Alkalicoccus urumqiensis]|uniref:Uncharacterized protein n=1 Tax=Alkalicoccus urumqiensis TaxID=1548213 RepID=A0A2P6MKD5_ALKUR|nr:hypothetical protein C6I21_02070 [Alkalicoccus urumqiensis]